jgi:leader peptidase (prepilin peptidase)/N-methyltransferase
MFNSLLVFVIGAVLGSFLNVCIHRLPRDQSLVSPGSRCPGCLKPIGWRDNIPLLSYLILRGRCRRCGAAISFRYFAVELLTAALLLLCHARFGFSPAFFVYGFFVLALVVVTFIDWEHHLIPVGEVVMPGIVLGLAAHPVFPELGGAPGRAAAFGLSLLGAAAGAALILLVARLGKLAFRKEAMGEGDIWLMAMIGAFLGWQAVFLTVFAASLAGSVVGVLLIASGKKKKDEPVPFGPFLALGALFALFWGKAVVDWYLGFVR